MTGEPSQPHPDQSLFDLYVDLYNEHCAFCYSDNSSDEQGDAIMARVHEIEKALVTAPAITMRGVLVKLDAFEDSISEQLKDSGLPELFFKDICNTMRQLYGRHPAPKFYSLG